MTDLNAVRSDLIQLVRTALDAASRPDELLDCARAADVLADAGLTQAVSERLAEQITEASEGSSAWRLQMQQSKHETWIQTGHKARVLAEAWSIIARDPAAEAPPDAAPVPPPPALADPQAWTEPDHEGQGASGGDPESRNYDQP